MARSQRKFPKQMAARLRARFLARRRVAVGRRAILMMPKREAPDHDTVGKHVAVAGGQSHVLADAGERVGRHPKFK
jgi:hypothetical protein